ncbi:MAG: hypothetical protein WD733_16410 [Bryobacterales bacterium]
METASSNNDSRPYLSVVVTARNDDHGGNLLRRMQTFVNALLAQAKRHEVPIELLVVDWNPPPGKPPLIDALQWPADRGPVEIRFIDVPSELHAAYRHAEALPLYQMIAKNVGIRRARGQFILVTNIDVVFSHALFQFFAQRRLRPGRMYRVDRYDAMEEVPVDGSIDEQLRYCEQNLIRINTRQGTFPVTPAGQRLLEPDDIVPPESGISFGAGWYPLEGAASERFRWVLNEAEMHFGPLRTSRNLILELEPGPGVGFLPFGLRITGGNGSVLSDAVVMRRQSISVKLPPSGEPSSIRLQLLGGGQQTADDPRILNFRVFSAEWDPPLGASESRPSGKRVAGTAGLRKPLGQNAPPRPRMGLMSIPRGVWGVFSKLRSAAGPVEIGVPLPLFLVERWRLRVQGKSLSVTLDPAWFRPWRRAAQPSKPGDIVSRGLNLLWGRGWYPQEDFKGERFRWARNGAEVILHTPQSEPANLRMLVEPGPALGYAPFHLRVRDGSGQTCTTATVNRRQWIELPLPWLPNTTQVISFQSSGDSAPRTLSNDSRSLCFRVLACAWSTSRGSAAPLTDQPEIALHQDPWTPISTSPGILLGAGWRMEFPPGTGIPSWRGDPDAEIILQRNGHNNVLVLDVESSGEEGGQILVREGPGPGTSYPLQPPQKLRLASTLSDGQTGVLRLTAIDPPSRSCAKANLRQLRLVGVAWEEARPNGGNGSERQTAAGVATGEPALGVGPDQKREAALSEGALEAAIPVRPSPDAAGPVFLHTNACGDFTLLAREHWFDLRGYPEFDMFSMNIDSVFCYSAHHGGAPEEFLPDPMRVYHIEHATGSGFTPEGQARLFERIAAKGIPWIDYHQVLDWAVEMRRLEAPLIFNRDNWGFEGIELIERGVPARAGEIFSKHSSRAV